MLHPSGDSLKQSRGVRSTESSDLRASRIGTGVWLEAAFGGKFWDEAGNLPIGVQTDGSSCGICVLNAIEHATLGHPLFTMAARHGLWVWYFLAAMQYAHRKVRIRCYQLDAMT